MAHHNGATTLLAHFHVIYGGSRPFTHALEGTLGQFAQNAELSQSQIEFLGKTAALVQKRQEMWKQVRLSEEYGNDYYWISQLFDVDWKPDKML